MSAVPRFPIFESDAGAPGLVGFIKATIARVTWRSSLVGLGVVCLMRLVPQGTTNPGIARTVATPMPWLESVLSAAVIEACCGLVITVAVVAADEAAARGARRLTAYALALVLGSAFAGLLEWQVRNLIGLRTPMEVLVRDFRVLVTQPAYVAIECLIESTVVTFVYVNLTTARRAARRYQDAEIARGKARRGTLESKLQAMQARVEPTFLFNTLAQVKELYETDVESAGHMLDDLIAYLRAALPHLRETSSTLGKEIELARAYLNIMRIRLGHRLAYDIEVPDAMKSARMPPMMLLPLVDHALVYGLGPRHDGGTIRIATTVTNDRVRLLIADAGAGFLPDGNTHSLDDIAARLDALYGNRAKLRLERVESQGLARGTCAILEIPHERHDGSHR
jgi:hypothetical protein